MASNVVAAKPAANSNAGDDAKAILTRNRSNEIWLGVVGPVGAGGSRAITALKSVCEAAKYHCEVIKMSDLIREWGAAQKLTVPAAGATKTLESVQALQDIGDEIRKGDPSSVARLCLAAIAAKRAQLTGQEFTPGQAVAPDAEKRAYLIDAIRHPAETALFRRAYGNAFALVGVDAVRSNLIVRNSTQSDCSRGRL